MCESRVYKENPFHKRFDSVPTEVEVGVKKLDFDGLESFAEAIFDFANIDDVKVWLKK